MPLESNGHFCQKIIPICKNDHFEPNNLMLQSMHSSITDFQLKFNRMSKSNLEHFQYSSKHRGRGDQVKGSQI